MKYVIQNKWWDITEDYNIGKLLYLLVDKPDRINIYDDFIWKNAMNKINKNYDLPSYIDKRNIVFWLRNDYYGRENNKPAVIREDGSKEYFK